MNDPVVPSGRARNGHAAVGRYRLPTAVVVGTGLDVNDGGRRELRVTAEASEMVTIPRAELDALRAGVGRLRREVGRSAARTPDLSFVCWSAVRTVCARQQRLGRPDHAVTYPESEVLAKLWTSPRL